MQIVSDKVERQEVIYYRRVTGVKCDCCDEIIEPPTETYDSNRYFRVTTGHYERGNDSCDSVEEFDICQKCLNQFVADYYTDTQRKSAYLNIRTKHVFKDQFAPYSEFGDVEEK